MRIRSDLEGVVYAHGREGVVTLAAGDTVPDGVEVGEHLTGAAKSEPDSATAPEETETKRAGNSRGRSNATRA